MSDPFAKGRCQWCNREEGHSDYCKKMMHGTPTRGEVESSREAWRTKNEDELILVVNLRERAEAAEARCSALEARNAELEAACAELNLGRAEQQGRAESAEARVAELSGAGDWSLRCATLQAELDELKQRQQESVFQHPGYLNMKDNCADAVRRCEAAEARCSALEGALRDIAHPDAMAISNAAREIALGALASHAAKAETGGEGEGKT